MLGQVQPHPEWRLIVAALSTRDYGTCIPHAEVAALTGLRYGTIRYFNQVAQARDKLLNDWNRELAVVRGEGYRLVMPSEFHQRSRRELVLAGRPLKRARKILAAAPQDRLTDQENARNADALAKIGSLETQRRSVLVETRPSLPAPKKVDTPKLLAG